MFSEVELVRYVAILSETLCGDRQQAERSIVTRLLKDLLSEKASKEHGYFLSITSLKSIGKLKLLPCKDNPSKDWCLLPVAFSCRTFLPRRGEILNGVVQRVCTLGVFLRCGPTDLTYLSELKMPDYRYVALENPFFLGEDHTRIEVGVLVRFVVLDVRYRETRERNGTKRKGFAMLASIDGDSLGPISMAGSDDSEM